VIPAKPEFFFLTVTFLIMLQTAGCERQAGSPEKVKNSSATYELNTESSAPTEITSEEMEWGDEITLNGLVQMAKDGQIQEIQWHVMPNIIYARTVDSRAFHIKNENKGVDIRKVLEDSGISIGEGGIVFRYLF
jgi:hypothetical protein